VFKNLPGFSLSATKMTGCLWEEISGFLILINQANQQKKIEMIAMLPFFCEFFGNYPLPAVMYWKRFKPGGECRGV